MKKQKQRKNSRWNEIKDLLDQNWSIRTIAHYLKISTQNIYRYIKINNYKISKEI